MTIAKTNDPTDFSKLENEMRLLQVQEAQQELLSGQDLKR